jgi:hypothetical protein
MPGSAFLVNIRVVHRSASALGMAKAAGICPEDSLTARPGRELAGVALG